MSRVRSEGMRLGIFARTFAGTDPALVLAAARDAGYDCVQWNWACAGLESMPEQVPMVSLDATRRAIEATGVDIVAVSGTFNMIHPDPAVRAAGLDRLDTVARHARELGTELVTLCTGTRHPHDQWAWHRENASAAAWEDLVASMCQAAVVADRHGVRLGIEPELANVVDGVARAQRLLEEVPARCEALQVNADLRIVIDAANLAERGDAAARKPLIAAAIEALGPHIEIAHAKDRHVDGRFAAVGEGAIDFTHYLESLARAGFDGPIVTHGLDAAEASRVARLLRPLLSDSARA